MNTLHPVAELLYRIAERAKELADLPMDTLRSMYPENTETRAAIIAYCKTMKFSRGDLIEAILAEEFEYDVENLT